MVVYSTFCSRDTETQDQCFLRSRTHRWASALTRCGAGAGVRDGSPMPVLATSL
jgi:hypothetical protein